MIRSAQGNIFDADTEALVNAVNTVGVMGKGIAQQFKVRFPDNFADYAAAHLRGDLQIHFPTKEH